MPGDKIAGNGGFWVEGEAFFGGDGEVGDGRERGCEARIGGEEIMLFHDKGIDELGHAGHPTLMASEGF